MTDRSSLATLARALGGNVAGQQVLCPGPGHSAKDRSLSVRPSAAAPEGFVVHSHAGDDPLDCRDHVRARMGWDRPTRLRREYVQVPTAPRMIEPSVDEDAKIARAAAIWNSALNPRGTVVERYLAFRGLDLPWQVAGESLRYHPRCPWRDAENDQTIYVPAMIGALRSMTTEELTGVHRTRLTPGGQKIDRRMLGKASGAAIMLCPMSALGGGLAVAEGIETALAGWKMGWAHVWALGSVGAIATLPLLCFDALTVMAETGDSGASSRAVAAVSERWSKAGREVIIVEPKVEGDLNDAIRGAA